MDRPSSSTWTRPLRWVLTGMTLLMAILLIWQCAAIYAAGVAPDNLSPTGVRLNDMYSREIVAQRLAPLTIPAIIWAVLAAVLIAARMILPPEKAAKTPVTPETRLKLMHARVEKTEAMLQETRRRRMAALICLSVCAVCIIISAVYLLNPKHFVSWDLEMVMGAMLIHVLPPMIVMFAALFLWTAWRRGSILRELEAAKAAPRAAAGKIVTTKSSRPTAIARIVLYAAAIALVIAGILNGGMYDVLVKAINICTECIGLG